MNKYKAFSEQAQLERKREKMCERKKAFSTEADAFQAGQRCYECPFCGKWHRSGSLATLLGKTKRIGKKHV